jgi:hypothetical protein
MKTTKATEMQVPLMLAMRRTQGDVALTVNAGE